MSLNRAKNRADRRAPLVALLSLLALVPSIFGAPLRVATWNMGEPAASGVEARLQEAATGLKKLNPQVIVLHQVRDWQMCNQLAQALGPTNYTVLVCSSFRDTPTGGLSKQQVGILANRKAYFAWSESWRPSGDKTVSGGFAFAAVRIDRQRLGIFAVQAGEGLSRDAAHAACVQQWSTQIGAFKHWMTNRIEGAIVSGIVLSDPPASAYLTQSLDALLATALDRPLMLPASAEASSDYVLARLIPDADALPGVMLDRSPAACDIDFISPNAPPVASATAPSLKPLPPKEVATPSSEVKTPSLVAQPITPHPQNVQVAIPPSVVQTARPPAPVQAQAAPSAVQAWWYAVAGVGGLALLIAVWLFARRMPRAMTAAPTFVALNTGGASSSSTVVITQQGVTGSASQDAAPPGLTRPVIRIGPAEQIDSESEQWRRRALAAEQKAEQAAAMVRTGLMPQLSQWLKHKLLRKLISDRADLIDTQHAAALRAQNVDERLARLEFLIQQQNAAYERRIDELTQELASAKEENRELIRAKIAQVKTEMEAARGRIMQQSKDQT